MSFVLLVVTEMRAVKGVRSADPLVKNELVDEVVEYWLHGADRALAQREPMVEDASVEPHRQPFHVQGRESEGQDRC